MCSYCGCESIDVIGRFMAEHVDIINEILDHVWNYDFGGDGAVVAPPSALAGRQQPHPGAEEAGLFAVLAEDEEFTEHVGSLCAEHTALDAALAAVRGGDHASFPAFELALRHHIDREENGLFPAAAIAFAGMEWERVTALTPAAPSRP